MKNRTINNVISILLIIFSIVIMFQGWITIADRVTRNDLREAMEDMQDEMDDINDSTWDMIDFALERYDIPVSTKKIVTAMEKVAVILEDAALSSVELTGISAAWITSDLGNMLGDITEDMYDNYVIGKKFVRLLDVIGNIGNVVAFLGIMCLLHFVITVLALLIQLLKPKAKSIFFMLSGLAITLCNVVTVNILNSAFEYYAEDYLDMERLFAPTLMSYMPAVIAILVFVIQVLVKPMPIGGANMVAGKVMNMKVARNNIPAMPKAGVAPSKFCPACGTAVSKEAVFCPGCGTFIAKQEPIKKTCKSCSTVLDDDALFCPNCGEKNE